MWRTFIHLFSISSTIILEKYITILILTKMHIFVDLPRYLNCDFSGSGHSGVDLLTDMCVDRVFGDLVLGSRGNDRSPICGFGRLVEGWLLLCCQTRPQQLSWDASNYRWSLREQNHRCVNGMSRGDLCVASGMHNKLISSRLGSASWCFCCGILLPRAGISAGVALSRSGVFTYYNLRTLHLDNTTQIATACRAP